MTILSDVPRGTAACELPQRDSLCDSRVPAIAADGGIESRRPRHMLETPPSGWLFRIAGSLAGSGHHDAVD